MLVSFWVGGGLPVLFVSVMRVGVLGARAFVCSPCLWRLCGSGVGLCFACARCCVCGVSVLSLVACPRLCRLGFVAGVCCGWATASPGRGSGLQSPAISGWGLLLVVVCGSWPFLAEGGGCGSPQPQAGVHRFWW